MSELSTANPSAVIDAWPMQHPVAASLARDPHPVVLRRLR